MSVCVCVCVNASMIPAGSGSLVMMSNFWLLAKVMRPASPDRWAFPWTTSIRPCD